MSPGLFKRSFEAMSGVTAPTIVLSPSGRVKLPALITVCAEANEPRYPTPIGIMKALKKPRHVWNAADLGCEPDMIGIPGSPSVNKRVFAPPKRNTDTKFFEGSVEEMAKAIVDTLEAERLI